MPRASAAGRLTAFIIAFCLSVHAWAAQRTFVSVHGDDENATSGQHCSPALPCRSFAAAMTDTDPGGEIVVIDSGGYGIVTIGQALSIIAPPGVYAGISVFAGDDGITVSAGPTDTVVLRGLTINGQGGNSGIRITSGNVINIEDCTIANMGLYGIRIQGGPIVNMARVVVRDNFSDGIRVQPSAATTITTTTSNSLVTGNGGVGVLAITTFVGSTVNAAVSRVTAADNASSGFAANSTGAGTVTMTVADSAAVENGTDGVFVAGANATGIVSGSSLVRNASSDLVQAVGAVLRTAGNNAVSGRGAADIVGTLTANPLK
jgi:hypothetical protein